VVEVSLLAWIAAACAEEWHDTVVEHPQPSQDHTMFGHDVTTGVTSDLAGC
jgi:hypothetical protein